MDRWASPATTFSLTDPLPETSPVLMSVQGMDLTRSRDSYNPSLGLFHFHGFLFGSRFRHDNRIRDKVDQLRYFHP